jgi:hypothetical protein
MHVDLHRGVVRLIQRDPLGNLVASFTATSLQLRRKLHRDSAIFAKVFAKAFCRL